MDYEIPLVVRKNKSEYVINFFEGYDGEVTYLAITPLKEVFLLVEDGRGYNLLRGICSQKNLLELYPCEVIHVESINGTISISYKQLESSGVVTDAEDVDRGLPPFRIYPQAGTRLPMKMLPYKISMIEWDGVQLHNSCYRRF